MRRFFLKRSRVLLSIATLAVIGSFQFSGTYSKQVSAQEGGQVFPETNTPQSLPFTQTWTNVNLITANDDWSGVPGVVGFLGDHDAGTPTGVDPRTLLTPFATNTVDVIANQTNVGITNGGVAEFELGSPTIALNGSGAADAPHIVIHLNTTNRRNIQFSCLIRDIDDTTDNAIQQVDIQWRAGGTGSWASVPGGYIADASTGPSTTTNTVRDLTLPAGADNQSLVEVRVITTNAIGNDEWVGVDSINVAGDFIPTTPPRLLDFNGDGKTDFAMARNTGGGANGQVTWMTQINGLGTQETTPWGVASDEFIPSDYDGDGKTDIAIWRSAPGDGSTFYALLSTGTVRAEYFGISSDDPSVVGDYDGDGNDDIAVYRDGASAGQPSVWYWRTVANGPVFSRHWGLSGDVPIPGDYDGDGSNDFAAFRNGVNWIQFASGGHDRVRFGNPGDIFVPGDYDGDGKTDHACVRDTGTVYRWFIQPSGGTPLRMIAWGRPATNDIMTPGDYNGDGKLDIAIWRPATGFFWIHDWDTAATTQAKWGSDGDYPLASFDTH